MMVLKGLHISRIDYGSDKGQYAGSAEFMNKNGEVKVRLTIAQAQAILNLCADAIVENAQQVASAMIAPMIEHKDGEAQANDQ